MTQHDTVYCYLNGINFGLSQGILLAINSLLHELRTLLTQCL